MFYEDFRHLVLSEQQLTCYFETKLACLIVTENLFQIPKQRYLCAGLMISPLMVASKNEKVGQKYCLGNSKESFTGSSPGEQIIHTGCPKKFERIWRTQNPYSGYIYLMCMVFAHRIFILKLKTA